MTEGIRLGSEGGWPMKKSNFTEQQIDRPCWAMIAQIELLGCLANFRRGAYNGNQCWSDRPINRKARNRSKIAAFQSLKPSSLQTYGHISYYSITWCRGSKPTRRGAPARINMLLSLVGYSGILGVHFFGTFGFTHNGTTFTYFNVIHLRR
jgi:hypothetical protein